LFLSDFCNHSVRYRHSKPRHPSRFMARLLHQQGKSIHAKCMGAKDVQSEL